LILGRILWKAAGCLHIFPGSIDVIVTWKRESIDMRAHDVFNLELWLKCL